MKKLLVILAIALGCSSVMLIDAKRGCCKKEKSCGKSCATKPACGAICKTRTEKRCVQVPCRKRIEKKIPREVCEQVCHTEYDTICDEIVEYKTVEQTRQVCDYNETDWSCPNGDCCNQHCTHEKCRAYCAANNSDEGILVPGSEEIVA